MKVTYIYMDRRIAGSTLRILEEVAVHSEIRPQGVDSSNFSLSNIGYSQHVKNSHDMPYDQQDPPPRAAAPWLVPSRAEVLIARMRKADLDLPRASAFRVRPRGVMQQVLQPREPQEIH